MRRIYLISLVIMLISNNAWSQKKICITIDDLPGVSNQYNSSKSKIAMLSHIVDALKLYKVPAVGFVVTSQLYTGNTSMIDSNHVKSIKNWLNNNLVIGNHSHSHFEYSKTSFLDYKKDILIADSIISINFLQKTDKKYFRHPYLQLGENRTKKDLLISFLKEKKFIAVPVTITNKDYLFSKKYDNAMAIKKYKKSAKILKTYQEHIINRVAFFEKKSLKLFHHDIPQVLLLHANTINSLAISGILSALVEKKYKFISSDSLFMDSIYNAKDNYVGKNGTSWLNRWKKKY